MESSVKERLLDEFRAILESRDIPDEAGDPIDLCTVLSELAALRSDIRLESRQVKSALDDFRAVTTQFREQNEHLVQELDRSRDAAARIRTETERRMLLDLLELRDRIDAGAAAGRAYRPGWIARLLARRDRRFTDGLIEGLSLILNRVDRQLAAYRVRPIEVLNRPLDPQCMNAVGAHRDDQREEGAVLAEQRRGFTRDGELLRHAEVIVNKKTTSS